MSPEGHDSEQIDSIHKNFSYTTEIYNGVRDTPKIINFKRRFLRHKNVTPGPR